MNFIEEQLAWVIYPYLSFAIMIIGVIYRFRTNQLSVTSKSSELLENKSLGWGARLFHWGLIFVILGHFAGLFVPVSFLNRFGVSDYENFLASVILGGVFGLVAVSGLGILITRRLIIRRVRLNSSFGDTFVLILLLIIMALGLTLPLGYDPINGSAGYTAVMANITPWISGFFTFQPNASLMNGVPLLFQIHILLSFLLYPAIPFTRLMHIFTTPIRYIVRKPIVYRRLEKPEANFDSKVGDVKWR
ncbi:Hdr-like menaquinol oxidoreductase cytochrome b-like subunit [Thermoplasmatales archaeon]|nr:Hdr-like menaquinol oxidoreductase cytochrome b-like subunit [Thermoplasmatales archaeon]